jgi:hypothetical protein
MRSERPSPCTGPIEILSLVPVTVLPASVVRRARERDAVGHLASALRELIG